MQSFLYNDETSYSDDERYDEDNNDDTSSSNINGSTFTYPSYDEYEDMM